MRRESVVAMLERERLSLPASLLGLSLLAAAIGFLPDPRFMMALLVARIASFLFTRNSARRLEDRLRAGAPVKWAERRMFVAMILTGATLGLMLWPPGPDAPRAAVTVIQLVVVVTATLIPVTLAAMPVSRDAMLASLWATAAALIFLHPQAVSPWMALVVAGLVFGVRMYCASAGRHIDQAAAMLVENLRLSEDLASALEHAEFLSWRDPLTGLLNRRKLFEDREAVSKAVRQHVLTIDLDHFKAINDRFGHAAGDHVIIAAADAIRALIAGLPGGEHSAFRLGGEEFLVILGRLDHATAHEAAEVLRRRIARIGQELEAWPGLEVTASVGFAEWSANEALDDVLVRSDLACYRAKDLGRNRVAAAA